MKNGIVAFCPSLQKEMKLDRGNKNGSPYICDIPHLFSFSWQHISNNKNRYLYLR
jgi:hypothetical protein